MSDAERAGDDRRVGSPRHLTQCETQMVIGGKERRRRLWPENESGSIRVLSSGADAQLGEAGKGFLQVVERPFAGVQYGNIRTA